MTTPSAAFTAASEVVGGRRARTLFHLAAGAPVSTTWYLSTTDIDAGEVSSNAYLGLVLAHSGIPGVSGVAGQGESGQVTLTLLDASGSGGPGRRFSDLFATPVSGYGEAYDLETVILQAYLNWVAVPSELLLVGRFRLQPEGTRWDHAAGGLPTLTLAFSEDVTRYRPLPRLFVTADEYPDAPDRVRGQAIPLWFGRSLRVPLQPLDDEGALWLIGASPGAVGAYDACSINTVRSLWRLRPDATEVHQARQPIQFPADSAFATLTITGNSTARDLLEVAQGIDLGSLGILGSKVRCYIRRKVSGTPAAGIITLTIVGDRDGLPNDDLVDPAASSEVDASSIPSGTGYTAVDFPFQTNRVARAPYLSPERLWVVVKYAKDGSVGDLEIETRGAGTYTGGIMVRRDTTLNEWVPLGQRKVLQTVPSGFSGRGYLRRSLVNGSTSLRTPKHIPGTESHGLYIGVVDDDGPGVTRMFLRYKISDLPGSVASARLNCTLLTSGVPVSNAALIEIVDFGTLDTGDWDVAERGTINAAALTPGLAEETALSFDVTTAFNAAKAAGLSNFAVKFQYLGESEDVGAWYALGEGDGRGAKLDVMITAGPDLRMAVYPTDLVFDNQYRPVPLDRTQRDIRDAVAVIKIGFSGTSPPAGPDVQLTASINGITDDSNGAFTGTAFKVIDSGADILRFLHLHPIGLGLTATEVDTAAFTTARTRLGKWFGLQGGLTEAMDPRELFARIARCCRATLFTNQDGLLSIAVAPLANAGSGVTPVRLVRPWEHGPLSLMPLADARGAVFPASRVDVFYAHDWLALPPGNPRIQRYWPWALSSDTAFDLYALISADQTQPFDATRQAQAAAADTRYGLRELLNAPVGVSPDTAYEWVPADTGHTPTGTRLVADLWDRNYGRLRPAGLVSVVLPRFALGWRMFDEFELESYDWPSAAARVPLGMQSWATEVMMDSGLTWYQARRARCLVRSITPTAEHGAEFPAQVIATIIDWDTP